MLALRIRVDIAPGLWLGPGKVQLLEKIEQAGSISAAARVMGMSYRRAWLLVEQLNAMFGETLIATTAGGPRGGGAALTPRGRKVLAAYRAIEARAAKAAAPSIRTLMRPT
jgi:molybdate transport system regulatory protein